MRKAAALVFMILAGCQTEKSDTGERARHQESKASKPAVEPANDSAYTLQSKGWLKVFTKEKNACAPHIEQVYTKYSAVGGKIISMEVHTGEGCFEGLNPELTVVKSFSLDSQFTMSRTPDWEFEDTGSSPEIVDQKYVAITESGCCGSSKNTKYFSAKNGKYLGKSDAEPLFLSYGRNESRLVLGESYRAASSSVDQEGLIKIYFSDDTRIIDSLNLDSDRIPEMKRCEVVFIDKIDATRHGTSDTISLGLECYGEPSGTVTVYLKAEAGLEIVGVKST